MVVVCSQWFFYGCREFSVVLVGSRRVHVEPKWFSVVVPVGSRMFSIVLVGSQSFLVVLVASQWFSAVLTCSRRFSVVLVGSQCSRRFSMVLSGSSRLSMYLSAS